MVNTRQRAKKDSENIEDDVKCVTCDKKGVEIECEVCLKWFHTECAEISALKFTQIVKHNFHWYCKICDATAREIHGKMVTLQTENTKLKQQLKTLSDKVNAIELTKKIANAKAPEERKKLKAELKREIKEELKPVIVEELATEVEDRAENDTDENPNPWNTIGRRNIPTPNLRNIIQEEMYERKQIDLIKKNLVISGITETGSEIEDLQKAKQIIQTELHIEAEIDKVERCGKTAPEPTAKPRVLKLFMKTQENRKSILQNAKLLRDSQNPDVKTNIFINADQTKKQQLESKNLRDKLKARRLEDQTKTFKIQKGVIIEVI